MFFALLASTVLNWLLATVNPRTKCETISLDISNVTLFDSEVTLNGEWKGKGATTDRCLGRLMVTRSASSDL